MRLVEEDPQATKPIIPEATLKQVLATTAFVKSEELKDLTRAVADATSVFYLRLISNGLPESAAAEIAAGYSKSVIPSS